jgi:NitT/TauT family transport system substrate-binding protein
MVLLAEGKIDAFLGFPPQPQELRAKQIGHVVVNSAVDRPWSQYFCCMVYARKEFARKYPMATKRALRAILKAVDLCALEPDRAAEFLIDKGYTERYDYTRQAMKDVVYGKWREYDPEDTVRFYALRLHEAGMIKSTP